MELWCQLKLFLLIILMLDLSAATFPEDTQHELVDETCDLTKLLVVQQDIARQAREEVVKKDGSIRQLRQDITTVQKTLKLVSDGAVLAQQQLKGCLEKNNDLEHQMKENDAAISQQITKILTLTTDTNNNLKAPQCDTLQEQILRLTADLITANSTIEQLSNVLFNSSEEMKIKEKEMLELQRRLEDLNKENQKINKKEAAQVIVDNYSTSKGLANDSVAIMNSACQLSDVMVVAALLDLGVNCWTSLDQYTHTCFHLAAVYNSISLTNLLLARQECDINVRRLVDGMTPLIVTAYYGNLAVADILLNNNADATVKSANDVTALGWASRRGQTEMVNLLRSRGAP